MRVLIPSDNRDFVAEMADAYQQAGCEVVTGSFNFELGTDTFDLIHYQWPEEFCEWKPPTDERLQQIAERLAWWQSRCPSIVTVHNFYPHGYDGNKAFHALYEMFYSKCSWLLHLSTVSRRLICEEFAAARHDRHIMATMWTFARTLRLQKKRGACRADFGFDDADFVVLVIGALRSWEEVRLISQAFSRCRVPKKRLLMAGAYHADGSALGRRWRQWRRRLWLWSHSAVVADGVIPENELYRYLDSADVVLVPRLRSLNSGIPSLALTFGTTVIAPAHGSFPEHLADTDNLLYETGNPSSLAQALTKAASQDRAVTAAKNRQKAEQCGFDKMVRACLHAVSESNMT